ncbi:MAG: LamG domain-containing protein [Candidatus Colwellbacteria bacterium]|nr:LamG domain-containing protein [Candidatus Colwellbacteria bacterium]
MGPDRQKDNAVIPAKAGMKYSHAPSVVSSFGERPHSTTSRLSSFTLVELLIVIAILAVLAAAVVVVLNPAELLAQARDSQRSSDMKTIADTVNLFILDNSGSSLGVAQTVYISLPDTSSTCATYAASLPVLPAGWSYHCVTAANLRNTDGTGWIPLNIATIKGGSPMPYLPIDPSNDAVSTRYYAYTPSSLSPTFELMVLMESEKITNSLANNDGGIDPSRLEIGSDISLWSQVAGLTAYWNFDEGSGTTAIDMTGRNNTGTIVGPTYGIDRKSGVGKALVFDGVDDYVSVADSIDMRMTTGGTFAFWIYPTGYGEASAARIIDKSTDTGCTNGYFVYMSSTNKFIASANAGSATSASDNSITMNAWNFITATMSSSGKKVYVNGKEVTSAAGGTVLPPDVAGEVRIGNRSGFTDRTFVGRIDDSRMYNRVLSASEVRSLYFGTK